MGGNRTTRGIGLMTALIGLPATVVLWGGCSFHSNVNVKSDEVWTEITRSKPQAQRPAPAPSKADAQPTRQQDPAVLAVFDIRDRGSGLAAPVVARLSDYLAMSLAAAGAHRVVPRDQLKARLRQQKRDSYKACYEQSCQIEVGRELAAEKTLSTVLLKLGERCTLTAVLYDLRRAASEGGASAEAPCNEEALARAIKSVVSQLAR